MTRRFARRLVVLACVAASSLAGAQDVATTKQRATIDGRVLTYTAQAGRLPIRSMEAEEPHGYIFYTAYRVPSTTDAPRPVTFLWGGGPSGPAIGVHMTFGPKKVVGGKLVDNANTLLTVSDLVFVDPVGTGFSRPTKAEYGAEFYNVKGDQGSVAEFIRVWRALNDPDDAPIFLYGVSYGTWRASGVTELLEKNGTHVTGVVLQSGGVQLGQESQPREVINALRTPGRAAAALHHGKLPPALGTNRDSIVTAATRWATTVYAPALAKAATLSESERDSIIAQFSRYTGFPAEKVDRKTLNVTPRDYLAGMFPGRTLSLNDMRVFNAPAAGGGSAANTDNVRTARYLRVDLGYRTDLAYLGSLERGYVAVPGPEYRGVQPWNYNSGTITPDVAAAAQAGEGPPGTEPWIRRAMAINPRIKVFVAAGLYDSLNSCAGNEDNVRRQDASVAANFTLKCYLSGHGLQRTSETEALFAADFRAFVVNAMAARGR